MARTIRWSLLLLVFAAFPSVGLAQEKAEPRPQCPFCRAANNPDAHYGEKAGNTLVRGALNTGLGWTELIRQPAKEAKAGGNVGLGLAKGLGEGVTRTFTGLAEVFTFWMPKVQDRYVHFAHDCPLDTTK